MVTCDDILGPLLHKHRQMLSLAKSSKSSLITLLQENEHLLVRECYLSIAQASDLVSLNDTLDKIRAGLLNHIMSECAICEYEGEACRLAPNDLCEQKNKGSGLSRRVWRHEVDKVARCPFCQAIGHRQCLADHDCIIQNQKQTVLKI